MSLSFYQLLEFVQSKAIAAKFRPTEETLWRSLQREYSKTFFTPLDKVALLDPEFVLLAIYENQMDQLNLDEENDLNRILDRLKSLDDPEYSFEREKEELEYNKQAELEEKERLRKLEEKKKPKEVKKEEPPPLTLPKSGGINLAYLADSPDSEG